MSKNNSNKFQALEAFLKALNNNGDKGISFDDSDFQELITLQMENAVAPVEQLTNDDLVADEAFDDIPEVIETQTLLAVIDSPDESPFHPDNCLTEEEKAQLSKTPSIADIEVEQAILAKKLKSVKKAHAIYDKIVETLTATSSADFNKDLPSDLDLEEFKKQSVKKYFTGIINRDVELLHNSPWIQEMCQGSNYIDNLTFSDDFDVQLEGDKIKLSGSISYTTNVRGMSDQQTITFIDNSYLTPEAICLSIPCEVTSSIARQFGLPNKYICAWPIAYYDTINAPVIPWNPMFNKPGVLEKLGLSLFTKNYSQQINQNEKKAELKISDLQRQLQEAQLELENVKNKSANNYKKFNRD